MEKKARIWLDREFKKNPDFWTKSRYLLKISIAFRIKSQKKIGKLQKKGKQKTLPKKMAKKKENIWQRKINQKKFVANKKNQKVD